MGDSSARDKRFFPRRSAEPVPVGLHWADGTAEPVPASVLDYSPSGLSIQVEHAIPVGTRLVVHVNGGPAVAPGFPVLVEHCQAHVGQYRLGCRFTAAQHWDDLQAFG